MSKRRSKGGGKHKGAPADAPKREGKSESGRAPVLKRRHGPNWLVLVLALAGMALTGYLAITSWTGTAPALCGEGSTCDLVQGSRWGSFLGLPTAFWGFLAYAAIGHVAFRERNAERHWKLTWFIALSGLVVSLYLTGVSILLLQATCFYCLISLGLLTAIFVVVAFQRPAGLPSFSWPAWGGQTAAIAVAAVVVLHLHYSGVFSPSAGPENPYLSGLADHLSRTGAVMYGAFW